jgi:hypothetical protein
LLLVDALLCNVCRAVAKDELWSDSVRLAEETGQPRSQKKTSAAALAAQMDRTASAAREITDAKNLVAREKARKLSVGKKRTSDAAASAPPAKKARASLSASPANDAVKVEELEYK